MSLARTDFKRFAAAVAPFALVFGLAANDASAAEGQPIAPKTCFKSDADGPANEKLNAAMKARDQKVLIMGNRVFPKVDAQGKPLFQSDYAMNIFTSNPSFSEGYNIESNAPVGQVGTMYCIAVRYSDVRLNNAYKSGVAPELGKLGELGEALTYSDKKGLRVMMSAKVGTAVFVVEGAMRDPDRLGSILAANSSGTKAGEIANLSGVDYADYAKKQLGLVENMAALSPR